MARSSLQQPLPAMEVERLDGSDRSAERVKKLDGVRATPLKVAKLHVGACVREAIGSRAMKQFGQEGRVSRACDGDVPDYLAAIYADRRARRKFGQAWLEDETDAVTLTLVPLKKGPK